MNQIVYKFSLAGAKFMSGLHSRQAEFTGSTCREFEKHRESFNKFKEPDDLKYIHKNKLDKACLDCDDASAIGKYLAKLTVSDKVMKDKAYEIALNPKYDGYQKGLAGIM